MGNLYNLPINHYIEQIGIVIVHDRCTGYQISKNVMFFYNIVIECVGFNSQLTSKYMHSNRYVSITALYKV